MIAVELVELVVGGLVALGGGAGGVKLHQRRKQQRNGEDLYRRMDKVEKKLERMQGHVEGTEKMVRTLVDNLVG